MQLQSIGGSVSTDSTALARRLVRRATVPLAAFAGTVTAGVAGFSLLAGVGVVEAAFWLLDPASIGLHFQTHAGPERLVKGYALVVFAALILSGVWIGETVLSAAFGGQIREEFERVSTQREIDALDGHVIICGYGIFGRTVAARLRDRGRDVVAIERDPAEFERIDDDGVLALNGDARAEETLKEAGVERAEALVAAIDDSNANIQTAITASQLAPTVHIVVRVGDDMYASTARRAGADEVIIPEVVSGERVTESL